MGKHKTDHNGGYAPLADKPSTMVYKRMDSANKNKWSREDQQYLLDNHKTMYIDDIAEHIGRSLKSTKDKAFRMGCSITSKPSE